MFSHPCLLTSPKPDTEEKDPTIPIPPTITSPAREANQAAQPETPEILARLKALTPAGDTLDTILGVPPLFMFLFL